MDKKTPPLCCGVLAYTLYQGRLHVNSPNTRYHPAHREARVMDSLHQTLSPMRSRLEVPHSIPGLVSRQVLVMKFINGTPLAEARQKMAGLSPAARQAGGRRVLSHVSEAYGRMILGTGQFQADGHPGNILVLPKGRVALLDYG